MHTNTDVNNKYECPRVETYLRASFDYTSSSRWRLVGFISLAQHTLVLGVDGGSGKYIFIGNLLFSLLHQISLNVGIRYLLRHGDMFVIAATWIWKQTRSMELRNVLISPKHFCDKFTSNEPQSVANESDAHMAIPVSIIWYFGRETVTK